MNFQLNSFLRFLSIVELKTHYLLTKILLKKYQFVFFCALMQLVLYFYLQNSSDILRLILTEKNRN